MVSIQPSLPSPTFDSTPAFHRLIGNINAGSFMQQEEVSTRLGWSLLHIDRRSDDDGSRTVNEHLSLLVSKEIAQQEDCHEEDSTEETNLAQHDMRPKR